MQQKTNLMLLLIIGALFSTSACKRNIDYLHYEEYHYINNSGHEITINAFYKISDSDWLSKTHRIGINEQLSQEIEFFAGSRTDVIGMCDSVVITYENEKTSCFVADSISPYNILRPENYVSVQISDRRNSNTYSFTEEDYDASILCEKMEKQH